MQGHKEQSISRRLRSEIRKHLQTSIDTKVRTMKVCVTAIEDAAQLITGALSLGNKILICGNGGSAADAQHIAAEFIVRLSAERNRHSLPAIALTTDTSVLTACSNDYGFNRIFSRQVEGLGQKGDILIGISTSGNSANVLEAMQTAHKKGLKVIGLLGGSGGNARTLCDVPIVIPAIAAHFIQESHIAVGHILCSLTEILLFDILTEKKSKSIKKK